MPGRDLRLHLLPISYLLTPTSYLLKMTSWREKEERVFSQSPQSSRRLIFTAETQRAQRQTFFCLSFSGQTKRTKSSPRTRRLRGESHISSPLGGHGVLARENSYNVLIQGKDFQLFIRKALYGCRAGWDAARNR
jgi:hypothetical protein